VPAIPGQKIKKKVGIQYSPDVQGDFPVLTQLSEKYGILFMISKMGYLFLYELSSGANIFRNRIR
jgi:clathrin heavy chain